MTFLKNDISDLRNEIKNYQLVSLPIFATFNPQTAEIQFFQVECFLRKRSNFNMMMSLYMTQVEISEFCLICAIYLS